MVHKRCAQMDITRGYSQHSSTRKNGVSSTLGSQKPFLWASWVIKMGWGTCSSPWVRSRRASKNGPFRPLWPGGGACRVVLGATFLGSVPLNPLQHLTKTPTIHGKGYKMTKRVRGAAIAHGWFGSWVVKGPGAYKVGQYLSHLARGGGGCSVLAPWS